MKCHQLIVILAFFICTAESFVPPLIQQYAINKIHRMFERYILGNYNAAAEGIGKMKKEIKALHILALFFDLLPNGIFEDTPPKIDILNQFRSTFENLPRSGRFWIPNYDDTSHVSSIDDDIDTKKNTFDFIVIGSGPSGSVIANRLSENPDWNILLMEAGAEANPIVDVPFLAGALQFTGYNWGYKAEQEDGYCRGCTEKRLLYPHGKVLGGSTIINYMIQVRGNPLDYDRWEAMGNPGWSYKEVLPYFLKSEDAHLEKQDAGYHKQGGYLRVSDANVRTDSSHAYVKAAQEAGHPYVDYNGKSQLGVSYVQTTTKNGKRASAEHAFLRPVRNRKNLKIITKSRATKILIDPETKQAYGVTYVRNKVYRTAIASKEVILSAGSLNSPQLLMLSGVGPKDHLEELDIPVLQDLPVGQKMYDHPTSPTIMFELNDTIVYDQEKAIVDINTYLEFLLYGRGTLTSIGGVEALTYIKTTASDDPDPSYPDMELIFIGGSLNTDKGLVYRKIFNVPQDTYKKVWKPYESKYLYQIYPMLVHPKSYGYIKLKSKNPFHWPKFYANFFSDPDNHDIKTFIAAIREVQRINSSPALQKYGATMVRTPIPGCESHTFDTDEYWECGIRTLTGTFYHQVATCKMGPEFDPEAVVDAKLRVYGIKNLRVADTSVIPLPVTAHTAGPAYMIGEKAADIIKEKWSTKPFNLINK